jgi:hypothetical protein
MGKSSAKHTMVIWLKKVVKILLGNTFSKVISRTKTCIRMTWVRLRVRRDPILVYQMGKVGSTALEAGIRSAYQDISLDIPIYRSHSFMDFDKYENIIKTQMGNSSAALKNLEQDKKLKRDIEDHPDKLWNLVSLVRDPVARNIAAFFQRIDYIVPNWKERWENKTLSIQELQEYFFLNEQVNSVFWFENMLEPMFGIDVYTTPFPHHLGYKIYKNPPRANLLLIRLEDLDQVAVEAIKKYLKLPNFTLQKINVGDEKTYSEVYRAMKQTPLPVAYIDRMYSTVLARHFYTEEELAAFAYKWTKKLV